MFGKRIVTTDPLPGKWISVILPYATQVWKQLFVERDSKRSQNYNFVSVQCATYYADVASAVHFKSFVPSEPSWKKNRLLFEDSC